MVPTVRCEIGEWSNIPNLLFELVKHVKEDEKEGIFTDPRNNADKNSWMQILRRKYIFTGVKGRIDMRTVRQFLDFQLA